MEHLFHIADLIAKKNKGVISDNEMNELQQWVDERDENLALYKKATDDQALLEKLEVYGLFTNHEAWKSIDDKLFSSKTISFFPQKFMRYAAVLIPFMLIAAAAWYFLKEPQQMDLVSIDEAVKPGSQKATLILADGGEIELDGKHEFPELKQGDIKVTKKQNSLLYTPLKKIQKRATQLYNELITPRGGSYSITLADQTEVILNAGSTLRFPVEFLDSVRQVFLEGEAYFKVAHDGKPFIVTSDEMDVRVLGTTFNISSYDDEPDVKATLVEGKVKVDWNSANPEESRILKPNDQAVLSKGDLSIKVNEVNTSLYTSWIQGKFEFNKDNLELVMKRLARWYDFEYEFKNNAARNFHFTARIDNNQSISSILEMLQMTTDVKFEIKDNTIIVL
jgi:transmembrane sensor